jgi:crotonobetainyl-CoA:carnitine CoA-transferase CaiB-like acyl-CoA transferase
MGDPPGGRPEFATVLDRLEHQDELDAKIEAWTSSQDKHELMERLQRQGVPAAAVATSQDRMENDPDQARACTSRSASGDRVQRYEEQPDAVREDARPALRPAPRLSEDNDYVCTTGCSGFRRRRSRSCEAEGVAGERAAPRPASPGRDRDRASGGRALR